jgi:hypothetical protein
MTPIERTNRMPKTPFHAFIARSMSMARESATSTPSTPSKGAHIRADHGMAYGLRGSRSTSVVQIGKEGGQHPADRRPIKRLH